MQEIRHNFLLCRWLKKTLKKEYGNLRWRDLGPGVVYVHKTKVQRYGIMLKMTLKPRKSPETIAPLG